MKKLLTISSVAILSICFYSCRDAGKSITNEKDYSRYLDLQPSAFKNLQHVEADLKFWEERLEKNPGDLVSQSKVAGLHAMHYHFTGNVHELHIADSIYQIVNLTQHHFGSGTYRAMANNDVTMHRFKEAKACLDSASRMGDDKDVTRIQLIDVAIELGDMAEAKKLLSEIPNRNSVEYLIRNAKIKDHEGNLAEGIVSMERAYGKLKEDKVESLYGWALTNLGDMYSHANRYEDAYRSYVEALQYNNAEFHALKGIAWLAFSHDKNTASAKRILNYLKTIHPVPDYDLMLSKIAAFENDNASKQKYEAAFLAEVTKPAYGGMYNKYIFNLYADELNNKDAAYQLALQEVNNRPTGESYNLLSWSLYKKGEIGKAKEIASAYVENVCYEPDALYHLGVIYGATGNKEKAKQFLKQAEKSVFELGPSFEPLISRTVQSL